MFAFLAPYKLYVAAAGIIVLLLFCWWGYHHIETIGKAKIKAQDAAALVKANEQIARENIVLQAAAVKAAGERDAAQKALSDYIAANPIGPVIVCNKNYRRPSVSKSAPLAAGNYDTGTGPGVGSQVLTGSLSQGPDISPELDTIVRSFGTLAGLYRELQEQPVTPK
jgi:hypothetical protein